MNSLKSVVIFGATSAIATEVARLLVSRGSRIFCVARNPQRLDDLIADLRVRADTPDHVSGSIADLAKIENHERAWAQARTALGTVDAVLIAHGTLPDQTTCQTSVADTLSALETNAVSVAALLTLIARDMEAQGRGVIAAISSVAGDRGRQSNYIYGAAKGMLTIFMQGLRNRLARRGVSVVTIKPGFVDTPMTAAFDKRGPLWATPQRVAAGIVRAMERGDNEVYLPGFWRLIMLVIRHIPERIFKRLSL